MTEETKTPTEETQTEEATKLLIDKPSDFKFHAAYMAYSETWDKIPSPDTRTELNNILTSLSKKEMSYSSLYRRHGSRHYEFSRERIETQRKRDWRQKQTRSQRNQRHKGRH
jgi:hypothetical protein